jgi:hypothetical protein
MPFQLVCQTLKMFFPISFCNADIDGKQWASRSFIFKVNAVFVIFIILVRSRIICALYGLHQFNHNLCFSITDDQGKIFEAGFFDFFDGFEVGEELLGCFGAYARDGLQ